MSKFIIYEYKCDPCDHLFDSISKPEDSDFNTCPKCKQPAPKQLSCGRQCDLMQKSLWMDGKGASHDRFERTRERQKVQERKNLKNNGVEFNRTPGG